MDKISSESVIADHEIIYKNDKPYIILDLKEYKKLVHSSKKVLVSNLKNQNKKPAAKQKKNPTGKEFMKGLEGIWRNRTDMTDSVKYVNNLRKKNSIRAHIKKQMINASLNK